MEKGDLTTKGDLNQQAIQRKLLRTESISYEEVDVYCSVASEDVERFITTMYIRRIEGWWLYNEELIKYNVCTVDQYRDSLRESVGR